MGSLGNQSSEVLQEETLKFESVEGYEQEKESLLENKTPMDYKQDAETEKKLRNLWVLDGQCYDLTDFVQRHPGGSAAISLGKGMDCSELFRTYHLMKSPPDAILKKYKVANPNGVQFPPSKFTFEEDGFIMTIRRRGREYFSGNKLSTKGPISHQILAIMAIFVIAGLVYPAFIMGNVWAALAHGLVKGLTAVNTGHSMSHFSLFTIGWLNTFVFRVFSPLVLSTHQIWSTSHIISHHINTLTGIDLQDNYPVKRVQPGLPHMWFHRIQVFYVPIVYLFGVPLWTLSDFFSSIPVLFTGKHEMRYLTLGQRLENTIALGLNIIITLALPFIFLPFGPAFLVFCASNVPSSLMLVLQIAVNHEVPECMQKSDPMTNRIDWGAHQVLTSHNFGVESAFALHTSGGLNMQIEHHLFPSVHYTHYRALSKIVKQACMEFNLPYNTSKHLPEAVVKHFRLLSHCSKP